MSYYFHGFFFSLYNLLIREREIPHGRAVTRFRMDPTRIDIVMNSKYQEVKILDLNVEQGWFRIMYSHKNIASY